MQKLTKEEQISEIVQQHIDEFLKENPIFTRLKLSEEQLDILAQELIIPNLKSKYEFSSYQLMKGLKDI
ncbi:hypothetical protein [Mannheimia haemolytica]|uniref:hypothetical protein n=1 Tax=Mannheimia haemolytica TaxID=75985 RepID=UPI001ADAEA5C|nr:hypothetical protein [Mannheimia haemolytica]